MKKEKTTRTSTKQLLAEYKSKAMNYIQELRNPRMTSAFSVAGYIVDGDKKKGQRRVCCRAGRDCQHGAEVGKDCAGPSSGIR